MSPINRIAALALVALMTLVVAAPAFATEDAGGASDGTTDTTIGVEPISAGDGPAVVVPPAEADEVEQPWTARFLIPLFVVTALVLVIGVAVAYNRNVRRRYKVTT